MTGIWALALRVVTSPDEAVGMRDRFEVTAREARFGRAPHCDWVLPGAGVSRLHAIVRHLNGCYLIEDRSANGTWLNGERLPPGEPCPLTGGDRLRIDVFEIVVGDEDAEAAMSPKAASLPRGMRTFPSELIDAPFVSRAASDDLWARDTAAPLHLPVHASVSVEKIIDEVGLRAAFDAFLARFDPRAFDMAPMLRKKHGLKGDGGAWGRYRRHFERVNNERDEYFHLLFGEVLVQADSHKKRNGR